MKFTEDQILAAARVLSDRAAKDCNVNKDDNWDIYCGHYIDDAKAAFATLSDAAPQVVADEPVAWLVYAEDHSGMTPQHPASGAKLEATRYAAMFGQTPTEVRPLYDHSAPVQAQEPYGWRNAALEEATRLRYYNEAAADQLAGCIAKYFDVKIGVGDESDPWDDAVRVIEDAPPFAAPAAQGNAKDAERWREVLMHVGATIKGDIDSRFTLRFLEPVEGTDLMRGGVAGHFTDAIDAAIAAKAAS